MGVNLTETAAKHVVDYLESRGKGVGIRLAVKTTGCSGLMYVLEPVDEIQPEDLKFSSQGVDVFVDPKSLVYVDGTEMDYVKQGCLRHLRQTYPPLHKGPARFHPDAGNRTEVSPQHHRGHGTRTAGSAGRLPF